MFKYIFIIAFLSIQMYGQEVQHITTLFDSLKTHPQTLSDEVNMERADVGKSLAYSNLYPKINLFGRYEYASSPTGMRPLTLNEMFPMIQNQTIPQPFSEKILRGGAMLSMPIFVKSIFTMASKAKMMYKSAESKKHISLLKNEAIIVSANANLQYLENLKKALEKKKVSLMKTKELIELKVNDGRAPKSALLKINNGLNQIDILKNNIDINKERAMQLINSLTGIKINSSIAMNQVGTFTEGNIKALDPLRIKVEADRLSLRAEKEKLWPVLVLNGNYNQSWARAYNNDKKVNEDFATVSITFSVPLFSKFQYTKIQKSRIDLRATEIAMDKMGLELNSQATQLQNSLPLINNSIALTQNSIREKEEILDIAKVSYKSGRLPIEDYLKYEDDVVLEKSSLYKAQAEKWQTIMKLAVIFGNNIEEIVK